MLVRFVFIAGVDLSTLLMNLILIKLNVYDLLIICSTKLINQQNILC